jgi:hypothetical protein
MVYFPQLIFWIFIELFRNVFFPNQHCVVLKGQSSVSPFYAYLNNHLTFHSISELCDILLCCKNKGNTYLRKNIKI